MELHPAQATIAKSLTRFRVLNCGRRFGKTVLAVEEMVGFALKKKDSRIVYYAPTRDDARDITWAILIKKCKNILTYKNESRLEVKIMTSDRGESSITLYGWESVQERGKGRGLANDFIVCDEVSSYRSFWVGWNEVLSPTLIDREGSAMFISTPKGFNHFYDLFNTNDKDWVSFHFTTYDNPYISVEEIEREKTTKPEDTFAQEYLADFRKLQGLVYKEFDHTKHLYSDRPARLLVETIGGLDWGYTNPTAIIKIERDVDNHYWVSEEWYRTGKTTTEICEYARTMGIDAFYPDPAEPDRLEEARKLGLVIREANKDVTKGIDSVRNLLKNNRLHIHRSCVNLLNEIETYAYKEKKSDQNTPEIPVKENDHGCLILSSLVITPTGEHKLEDIHKGDFVWDGFSWVFVQEAGITGTKKTIVVSFSDGSSIEGTPDHPVFVIGRGLVPLGNLKYNDHICKQEVEMRKFLLRGISIEDTQMPQRVQHGSNISYVQKIKTFFIEKFIRSISVSFQKVLTSTTRMGLLWTTESRILNYYRKQNIQGDISMKNRLRRTFVASVVKNLSLESLESGAPPNSVTRIAEPISTTVPKDILKKETVSDVEKCEELQKVIPLTIVTVSVVSVQAGKKEKPVYNLKTSSGIFCANGILVSNCDALRYALFMQEPVADYAFEATVFQRRTNPHSYR